MNHHLTLLRRYLECAGFVLLWMAGEHYLHLSPIAGQLLGIPLIALFQVAIARRPLVQLWAFDAASLRVDRQTLAIAGALALACTALLLYGRWPTGNFATRLPLIVLVLAAAVPAAIALRAQRAAALRRALPAIGAALIFRVGWHLAWQAHGGTMTVPSTQLGVFLTIWLCEFVALFLVDEVAFRGALDPHLAGAAKGRRHACGSAVFLSILWALWHLPAYNPGAKSFLALFAQIGPFSLGVVGLGLLLTLAARQSRTLAPTSALHAFGNAYVLTLGK